MYYRLYFATPKLIRSARDLLYSQQWEAQTKCHSAKPALKKKYDQEKWIFYTYNIIF